MKRVLRNKPCTIYLLKENIVNKIRQNYSTTLRRTADSRQLIIPMCLAEDGRTRCDLSIFSMKQGIRPINIIIFCLTFRDL